VTRQPSLFVSYAHEDSRLAQELATAMKALGARVWVDQGELLIGDSLIERISEAIAEFDFVAALVSPASVRSNWCRKEIALAMSKQLQRGSRVVTVLPVRVGDVEMPPSRASGRPRLRSPGRGHHGGVPLRRRSRRRRRDPPCRQGRRLLSTRLRGWLLTSGPARATWPRGPRLSRQTPRRDSTIRDGITQLLPRHNLDSRP